MKPFSAPLGESLTGLPLFMVTMTGCSAGFMMFGYDQGVANSLQQNAHFWLTFPKLYTDSVVLGAVLGLFVVGAMFGCLANAYIGNGMGRRPMLAIGAVLCLIGSILQAASINLPMFIVARLINGFAVGILTSITPTYVAEISRASIRGKMMSLELVFCSSGLMTAFWVAYGFRNNSSEFGWRFPLAIQIIYIIVTLICLLFTPESPRWLIEDGRVEDGRAVLTRLHGADYAAAAVAEIEQAIALEHAATRSDWGACLEANGQSFRYRTLLSIGVNVLQQATGVNMATYYVGTIFTVLDFNSNTGGLATGGLGLVGFAFMVASCFLLMEQFGRVRTLMLGSFLQCVGMACLAGGIAHISGNKNAGVAAAFGLYLYIAAFSSTWLPVGWMYAAEVSALAVRSQVAALSAAAQYACNFAVVMVTPVGISSIGWKYFVIFGVFNFVTIPILYIFFPEVAGLSLEGVDELFADGKVTMRRSPREALPSSSHHLDMMREKNESEKAEYLEHA